ncbi:MAG: VacJ family lipoprotein, partial [bacterium]|nr:VacJ family lipoprotein [bacterium]
MRRCSNTFLFLLGLCGAGLAPSAGSAQSASGQPDPLDGAFEDPAEFDDDDDFADFLPDAQTEAAAEDPLEGINRPIFEMNLTLDRYIMRPVTRMYMEAPQPARNGVSNVLDNLQSPVILVNDLLQGEMSRAGATFGRFFINSVFGVLGLFDLADEMGLPGHDEDFGQTLASYGVDPGPYVVLPFLGP